MRESGNVDRFVKQCVKVASTLNGIDIFQNAPSRRESDCFLSKIQEEMRSDFNRFNSSVVNYELLNGHQTQSTSENKTDSSPCDIDSTHSNRYPIWAKVSHILLFLVILRMSINIWFQYEHDKHLTQINRLEEIIETLEINLNDANETTKITAVENRDNLNLLLSQIYEANRKLKVVREKLDQDKSFLKKLGAPYINFAYICEVGNLFLLSTIVFLSLLPQIYYKNVSPFDFGIIRLLVDEQREFESINALIMIEVQRFIFSKCRHIQPKTYIGNLNEMLNMKPQPSYATRGSSSSTFSSSNHFSRSRSKSKLTIKSKSKSKSNSKSRSRSDSKLEQNNMEHSLFRHNHLLADIIRLQLVQGKLVPFNRLPDWIKEARVKYRTYTLGFVAFFIQFWILFLFIVPHQGKFFGLQIETEPLDLLFLVEVVYFYGFAFMAVGFYLIVFVLNGLDQLKIINELTNQTKLCTVNNRLIFLRIKKEFEQLKKVQISTNNYSNLMASIDLDIELMNSNLVLILLHYRIFIAQLKPILRSTGPLALLLLCTALCLPVMLRLHLPYLNFYAKIILLITSISAIFWVDICLLPICLWHERNLRLHRSLNKLLAHTVEVQSEMDSLYYAYSTWVLRQELSRSDLLVKRFAVNFGLDFTYPNLLRVHFWAGLVFLSTVTWTGGGQKDLVQFLPGDSLLSDPLGYFKDLN